MVFLKPGLKSTVANNGQANIKTYLGLRRYNAFQKMSFRKILLLIMIMISNSMYIFSQDQNMENKIEKAKALGKDSIIRTANNIIENKYPNLNVNLSDFEIKAWSNKENIIVKFKRLIKFIPLSNEQSDFEYDLSINIETKEIAPIDTWGINNFYIPTEEDLKKIQFVKEAFNLPHSGFDNEVLEKADFYVINLDNDVSYGRYRIDKVTGEELINSIQGSYVPNPNPDNIIEVDPLIEIKE